MRVLVACECSGVVRDAFIDKGVHAVSCDILPSDSDYGEHYTGDVMDILYDGWDMLIGFPPCTYLTVSGVGRLIPGGKLNLARYFKGVDAAKFFMSLYKSGIPRICLENPVPNSMFNLPPYSQIIHPYYFGEPFSKRTCLWLENLPFLRPTCTLRYFSVCEKSEWFNTGVGFKRQKKRSRTFSGVGWAMASQWSNPDKLPELSFQTELFKYGVLDNV